MHTHTHTHTHTYTHTHINTHTHTCTTHTYTHTHTHTQQHTRTHTHTQQHTLIANEIQQDIDDDEGARSPDPGRAVDDDGPGTRPVLVQAILPEVHVLQEAQHRPRVVGDAVVRPRLEVKLVDAPTLGLL